ncbi:luciferase family protein [Halobacteriaceae archaeon GCM10025711]
MTSEREQIAETVTALVEEVSGWSHVTTDEHRFGGTEFRIGPREFGHVHAWGMLDIAFFRGLRDQLVAEELTGVHHLLAESGWTTFHVESPDDYDRARWLLRLSYLSQLQTLKRTPAGREEFADVAVEAEVADMGLSDDLRRAFERRTPA